jgi:hypothetical protein
MLNGFFIHGKSAKRVGFLLILCLGMACSVEEAGSTISADVCKGADVPQFRNLCVVTANQIHFKHTGPARTLTVVRSVSSVVKGTVYQIPEGQESYTFPLNAEEPFAKYSIFFSGSPALDLDFYHGKNLRPLTPKPSYDAGDEALWWIADDGTTATRMSYGGSADTYDLKTATQIRSYQTDPRGLMPYGKHMLLRLSVNKVERFFPAANSTVTFVEAGASIHSFWRQGDTVAYQTADGTVNFPSSGRSRVFPLGQIATADSYGFVSWRSAGSNCGLDVVHSDWYGSEQILATKTGLCQPVFGFSFLTNLVGVTLKGSEGNSVFFGTQDLSSSWTFDGDFIYMDEKIGIAKTRRLEYAYQNGTSASEQGLLECAAGAVDMNPNAGMSLFYDSGTLLIDDIPEHLEEISTHQNVKSCFGF